MAFSGRGLGPETKGGGFRGGPKRWTGGGPRPARHIPWPEIFKHHISVVEGHLKMLEMIKKHTVPETGNWRQICPMVARSHEMLRMIPPSNQREQMPLRSSSDSMDPGYSPADPEYGKAAQGYGFAVTGARKEGIDFKPGEDGPEYKIAQARGAMRTTLAGMRAAKAAADGANRSGSGSGSEARFARGISGGSAFDGQTASVKSEDAAGNGEDPYFIVDANPTPVNLPGISHKPAKRPTEDRSPAEAVEKKKTKKAKTKHNGELPGSAATNVEVEDISEEVDARLKEKEERRRRKGEKKRKRLSAGSTGAVAEDATTEVVGEKPKKKKAKKAEGNVEAGEAATKKRHGSDGEAALDGEGHKKKRKKTKGKYEDS
ncbi:hypothetical protein LPUS_08518 [Lasallia pustulata]|uniref:Uncharacterized protein n=1 Tax=Lasallia pustulata TaxID=136370 RepID=A0A1W5D5L9_9LECA|nr:hypothetical protein LPUS_08518 [Lasallia pustulata]